MSCQPCESVEKWWFLATTRSRRGKAARHFSGLFSLLAGWRRVKNASQNRLLSRRVLSVDGGKDAEQNPSSSSSSEDGVEVKNCKVNRQTEHGGCKNFSNLDRGRLGWTDALAAAAVVGGRRPPSLRGR